METHGSAQHGHWHGKIRNTVEFDDKVMLVLMRLNSSRRSNSVTSDASFEALGGYRHSASSEQAGTIGDPESQQDCQVYTSLDCCGNTRLPFGFAPLGCIKSMKIDESHENC